MIIIKNIIKKIGTKGKIALLVLAIAIITVLIALNLKDIINKKETTQTYQSELANETHNEMQNNDESQNIVNEIENTVDTQQEEKEEKKPTTPNKSSGPTYYIKVNYGAQVVNIYKKDKDGNYTVPVKAMVCSTGTATPTSGVYSIPRRWKWLRLQGYVWGHYTTQITGNILFHSVPYLREGENDSLEYWEYDKLGTPASAGCIRLQVKDAKWIYDNCAKGTKVEFYSSPNPGPLGKPSAKKISNSGEELRNWDPTDPASNNPWKNARKEDNDTQEDKEPTKPTNTVDNNIQTNTIKNDITNNDTTNTNTVKNNTIKTNAI